MKIEKMNVRRSGVGWLISLLVVSVFLFNPWSIYAGDSAADTFERVDKVFAGFNPRKVSRAVADIFLEKEFPTKKETVSKKAPAQAKEEKNEKKPVLSIEQLQAYTGCYRGDELLTPYELGIRDGQLHFTHTPRPSEKPLEPVSPDTFVIGRYMIKFTRDAAGKVTGFTFDSGEIKGITLLKQYLKP